MPPPIVSDGVLLTATFNVVGTPGTVATLGIAQASLNEGAIPATLHAGTVTIVPIGDANGDFRINVLDLTEVARAILLLDAETPGADANQDGIVDVLDLTKIVRIILMLD